MSNVIPFRPRRPAGDAAPQSDAVPWGFLAALAIGLGALEGIKIWSGMYREPTVLPGARLIREPSRIYRGSR